MAAGFTDRVVRAWRTAPNAPYPPAADDEKTPPSDLVSNGNAKAPVIKGASAASDGAAGKGKSVALLANGSGSGADKRSSNGTAAGGSSMGDGRGDVKSGGGGDGGDSCQPVRFVGHSQPVYGISWSPDRRFLLSGGGDGEVRLWDMARGRSGNAAGYVRYDGHW